MSDMDWKGIPEEYRNKIVVGDARVLMQTLLDESIGVILTSPPYNVGLNYEGFDDNISEDEFKEFSEAWLKEAFRVAKESAMFYLVVSDKMKYWTKPMAEEVGWKWIQDLIWCKSNMVGRTGIEYEWAYMSEPIQLFRKGERIRMINGGLYAKNTFNWFIEAVPQSNYREGRIHPAQFPKGLCLRILSRTPGEPILDPFAGSGSVLVASKMLGRSFVGFDIVKSVVDKANERITNTMKPLLVEEYDQMEFYKEGGCDG